MIWKRNSKPSPATAQESTPPREAVSLSPPVDPEREVDSALDTIGGILRASVGLPSISPESEAKTTGETCERWATHLMLRTPAPDVARYGGEEFGIILRETVMREATLLSERLLERVRDLNIEHAGRTIKLTVSVRIAEVQPGETPETWLKRTDQALYEAKNGGRDRVACARTPEPPPEAAS